MDEKKEIPWIESLMLYKRSDGNFALLEVEDVKMHVNEAGESVRMIYLKDKAKASE